jgi:di/tricarboxylate transporter
LAESIAFGDWMLMALPISIVMLIIVWILLSKVLFRIPARLSIDQRIINQEYAALGTMRYEEKAVPGQFSNHIRLHQCCTFNTLTSSRNNKHQQCHAQSHR